MGGYWNIPMFPLIPHLRPPQRFSTALLGRLLGNYRMGQLTWDVYPMANKSALIIRVLCRHGWPKAIWPSLHQWADYIPFEFGSFKYSLLFLSLARQAFLSSFLLAARVESQRAKILVVVYLDYYPSHLGCMYCHYWLSVFAESVCVLHHS